jgi:hypothetical protein
MRSKASGTEHRESNNKTTTTSTCRWSCLTRNVWTPASEAFTSRTQEQPTLYIVVYCQKPYIRDFYSAHPKATTVIIQPGERPKDALARHTEEVKNIRTLNLSKNSKTGTSPRRYWRRYSTYSNHRTPSPPPENWDCPPTRPEEDQAAPHVADPNFDWGNIRQLPPAADLQE